MNYIWLLPAYGSITATLPCVAFFETFAEFINKLVVFDSPALCSEKGGWGLGNKAF